jgi:hypothetical protein
LFLLVRAAQGEIGVADCQEFLSLPMSFRHNIVFAIRILFWGIRIVPHLGCCLAAAAASTSAIFMHLCTNSATPYTSRQHMRSCNDVSGNCANRRSRLTTVVAGHEKRRWASHFPLQKLQQKEFDHASTIGINCSVRVSPLSESFPPALHGCPNSPKVAFQLLAPRVFSELLDAMLEST